MLAQAPYVASIKRASGEPGGFHITPGRFVARGVTARFLVAIAYGLQPYQIIGGPAWIDSERFDVEARLDDEADMGQEGSMIKALLADRFRFLMHKDTSNASIYALVVGVNGSKIKSSADQSKVGSMNFGSASLVGTGVPLELFASLVGSRLGRTVIDRTNLVGRYDIDLNWTSEREAPDVPGPSIFTAIQEQLGLKLQSAKGPSGFLVIDRMERPSEN
jgi:uncharacterized protein (TIGR03435 family)